MKTTENVVVFMHDNFLKSFGDMTERFVLLELCQMKLKK